MEFLKTKKILFMIAAVIIVAIIVFTAISTLGGSDSPADNQQERDIHDVNPELNKLQVILRNISQSQDTLEKAQIAFADQKSWFEVNECYRNSYSKEAWEEEGAKSCIGVWEASTWYRKVHRDVSSAQAHLETLITQYNDGTAEADTSTLNALPAERLSLNENGQLLNENGQLLTDL